MSDDLSLAGMMPAWAVRIRAAWQKSTEAIFETGQLIIEAKEALPHGAFTTMIETELPFGTSTAQRLMAIARDERLANPAHVQLLPPSWGTLYELTKLDDEQLEQSFSDGTIRPDMERGDVVALAADDIPPARQRINGHRALMSDRREPDDSLDYFPTPPWATRALIEEVLVPIGHPLDDYLVWEPACGEGHISGVIEEYGADVLATDIFDYSADGRSPPGWAGAADFLNVDPHEAFDGYEDPDWIITNPPFGDVSLQFALKALRLARRGVALFVRQQWLEGIDRYQQLFRDQPPTIYAQFAERVNLRKGEWDPEGTTATAYCWLVWINGQAPHATQWIPPGQRVARSRDDDVERFTAKPVISFSRHGAEKTGGEVSVADTAPPVAIAVSGGATLPVPATGEGDPSASPVVPSTFAEGLALWVAYRKLVAADEFKGRHTRETAAPLLRAGYACDPVIPTKTMASDLDAPLGSVLGWASRLGLTKSERRGGPDHIGQKREATNA